MTRNQTQWKLTTQGKGKRQKAKGNRQKAKGKRQKKAKGKRHKVEGKRQMAKGKRQKAKGKDKGKDKGKGKGAKSDKQDKECYECGKKGHFARDNWARSNQDRTVNEVEGAKVDPDAAKEFVFTIENVVKDVSLSQSGCEGHEDGLVMIDSGAWVNV